MYRKGEMRHKNYKRVKEGGGGMARDRQWKRENRKKKKEIATQQWKTAWTDAWDACSM